MITRLKTLLKVHVNLEEVTYKPKQFFRPEVPSWYSKWCTCTITANNNNMTG